MTFESSKPEFRDNRAEVLLRLMGQAKDIDALHGKEVTEVLGTEQARRDFIENLTENEFVELLNGINGILRDKSKKDWKMDGVGVILDGPLQGTVFPPHDKDKPGLLNDTLFGAQQMDKENRSLEDIGVLFGASVCEIHPYMDGNGRTARLMYVLMKNGVDKESIRSVLGTYGGDMVDFNIGKVKPELKDIVTQRVFGEETEGVDGFWYEGTTSTLNFQDSVSESSKLALVGLLKEPSHGDFLLLSFHTWIKDKPNAQFFQSFPVFELGGRKIPERSVINLDKLIPELREEDVLSIIAKFWEFKKEVAQLLIDSVVYPNKPEYQVEKNKQSVSLLSILKSAISQEV